MRPAFRPLGFGELLDRAIETVAANLRIYAVVCLCYAVPEIALAFRSNADGGDGLLVAMNLASLRGNTGDTSALDYLALLYATIAGTIEYGVLFVFSDRLSAGTTLPLRAGLALALRRLPRFVACALAYVVLGVADVAVAIGLIAVAALGQASAAAWALVLIAALALAAANVFPCLVIQFAMIAVANEGLGVRAAFAASARRLWSAERLARAIAVETIAAFVILGALVAAVALGAFTELFDSSGTLLNVMVLFGTMASTALVASLLAVFARDLRVRAEGLDLALVADALAEPARLTR